MSRFKKYRSIFWAVVVLVMAAAVYLLMNSKEDGDGVELAILEIPQVPVRKMIPEEQRISIPVLGKIESQRKFDVYSEVNGLLVSSAHRLLPASFYRKGELIAQINSDQLEAEIRSQKSAFKSKIVSLMAIVKMDFSENYTAWDQYIKKIDQNRNLLKLPKYKSEKEALYFVANGVEELFFQIKGQEELLVKYKIFAPFDGFITDVMSKEGALVSSGQKLATFIGKQHFDIVLDVKKEYLSWIQIGDVLQLKNGKEARIRRVEKSLQANTQTVKVYAVIIDEDLLHGEYVSGEIKCSKSVKGLVVDRKLLNENSQLFICKQGKAHRVKVNQLISFEDNALISGIDEQVEIMEKISGIKEGQKIDPVYVN